ncbi:MAG: valine--tRNA ligase [Wolbachia endosymbiont of Fragariocoptes setiger]|nr:valine--tRNA ligase [Wolbachia endosymbiont of Fragariocoptes setiger]
MLKEKYNFREIECKYNTLWDGCKLYKWNGIKNSTFTIDTPPPTISGKLHIGHVFSYCHTDFVARFQRMLGKDVFYPIGFDDNGLPTERLVERTYNVCARDIDREKFIEMCHEVINHSKQEFKELLRSVGISYDWDLEYHTISRETIILSQMSFIDLFNKGYAYRKIQPILWDPIDRTAIAQAEIEDKTFESSLNTIAFSTTKGNKKIHVATTRPELLPACVAIFYHPDDERYTHLTGKTAVIPITCKQVPIIADDKVKIEKGTGLVMCCTFGDELDVYWHNKHNLPTNIIIDQSGTIVESAINEINSLNIPSARKKIIEILNKDGLITEIKPILHSVKCAERSGSPLEILPTNQWFIKTLEQKDQILQRVNQCNWHPESMRKRMEIWVKGLNSDWCISRQRYFGIPFPVWYSKRKGEEGKILLPSIKDLPVNPLNSLPKGYNREEVIADSDVMDTWFTSAITPQLNSLAISDDLHLSHHRHNTIFPADLRSQSHEIIRTWAFYTILKSHYHSDSLPWKNIMISGWCLADDKKKMSKSKGNIITPQLIINTYGADVVRYWTANSRLGVDTVFSENVFRIGKRLITKLWNASKFVSMFIEKQGLVDLSLINQTMDKWIISKLHKVIKRSTYNLSRFEYCEALNIVEEFFWKNFCDNYLELVKRRAYGESVSVEANSSAKQSLAYVMNVILRLFAPFLPYITEEIYHQMYSYDSIHNRGNWPKDSTYDKNSEEEGDNCLQILDLVRKIKAGNNISIKHSIKKLTIKAKEKFSLSTENDLLAVCNAELIEWSESVELGGVETNNGKFIISIQL